MPEQGKTAPQHSILCHCLIGGGHKLFPLTTFTQLALAFMGHNSPLCKVVSGDTF